MKILSGQYPACHNQPLTLTFHEITHPQQVIDYFFNTWQLSDIRYTMKEWLYEAYNNGMAKEAEFLFLHDELMRLVEAMWALQQQNNDNSCHKTAENERHHSKNSQVL